MRRARLVNGPFHGHEDTILEAPGWVTVHPACPCCQRPHLMALDPDRPSEAPAYTLEYLDAISARYRYVLDLDAGPVDVALAERPFSDTAVLASV